MENQRFEFPVIDNKVEGVMDVFHQRVSDGYINATELCKACSKQFGHYKERRETVEFLQELSSVIGIPITELIHIINLDKSSLNNFESALEKIAKTKPQKK